MKLKDFLLRSLTWWHGQTWGTYWYTRRNGTLVGADEFGNRYYRGVGPTIDPSVGPERRWVTYAGETDPSIIPPAWRGWLTHTHSLPPSEQPYAAREWEKPHLRNLTGTPEAYRPQGSTLASGRRPAATGDYVAWSPDDWSPAGPGPGGREPEGVSPDGLDVPRPQAHPGTHGVGLKQAQHG